MSRIAYVNGQYVPLREAAVHIEDRGYQFADGVYEVFAVLGGKLIGEQGHLDRLGHSLNELHMAWPMGCPAMMVAVKETVRRNHVLNGMVYLQITRGVAPRLHAFPTDAESTLIINAKKLTPPNKETLSEGVEVITIPDIRWQRRDIKSISLLPNVLGNQQAKEAGAYEAWQIDDEGMITEGTLANAWIVTEDGELITRNIGMDILNGITRLTILEAAEAAGIKVTQRAFSKDEALAAREAFLSSSTSHVKAVTRIDGQSIGNDHAGELTLSILDHYMDYIESHGGPRKTDIWK